MRTKSENKRQALVVAATEVFVERGYEAASMSEISARAGGSKATLYNYFSSKEALFLDVMGELTAELSSSYVKLQPGGDLAATLRDFGLAFVDNLFSPQLRALHAIVMGGGSRSEVGKLFYENGPKTGWTRLSAFMAVEIGAGRLREADPWTAAMHFHGLLMSECQAAMMTGLIDEYAPKAERPGRVAEAVRVFLAAYGR
ncbi:TetR/AcrR family transcriptional regulator [Chromobacterium sp. ATCC 53434]|uniref:TetR/AcrR family transcriptional regulator n=1 Tax=Chromobacterium sp. (strain ATCC 53434 / SC 14030) TaxID=2059672 RepID=UPI000C78D87C|nr:TetR/AcrR family transcriptional regulator [Chromobacterium sp. ATCC 53434]AUH49410.1 TetR/AcrR family transcriptional regulator [Chromobacterium sp. ATCC 53434]